MKQAGDYPRECPPGKTPCYRGTDIPGHGPLHIALGSTLGGIGHQGGQQRRYQKALEKPPGEHPPVAVNKAHDQGRDTKQQQRDTQNLPGGDCLQQITVDQWCKA